MESREKALKGAELFYYERYYGNNGDTYFPNDDSQSYGDFKPLGKRDSYNFLPNGKSVSTFVEIPYCTGSDYCNSSLVEESNFRVMKQFAEDNDLMYKYVWDVYGGYGTFGLYLKTDCPNEEIWEMVNGLSDYPLLDEDDHSQLEMEKQDEAWESWVRSDFKEALSKKFDFEDNEDSVLAQWFNDEMTTDQLYEIFNHLAEAANEYWINESSDNMYIHIDRIVEKCTREFLQAYKDGKVFDYKTAKLFL